MLTALEARQAELKRTLIRISGAIQVLEELFEQASEDQYPIERAETEHG